MRIRIVIVCLVSFLFSTQIQSQENTTRGVSFSTLEQEQPVKGNIYAIIMGISSYPFLKPLNYADKDAELFKTFLKSPAGGNVKEENIFMLLNEDAKAASFWVKGQAWLKVKNLQKGDRVYYFFAGHGDAISKEEYFFLTYDCNPAGDKNNYIVTGNLPLYNLKSRIAQMSTQGIDVVLIMDACRSNELPGGAEGQKSLSEAVVEKKAGETIMLSASSGQEAIEDRKIGNGHGLFTYYLIDGLSGNADIETGNKDGRVDFAELEDYVRPKVRNEAQQKYNHRQIPYFATNEPSKIINKVDTNFLKQWQATKQTTKEVNSDYIANTKNKNRQGSEVEMDSNITKLYNYFSAAIKKYHLIGDSSAEYWYNKLKNNYLKHSLTEDATYTLATEMVNFAQAKINFYLNEREAEITEADENNIDKSIVEKKNKILETPYSITAQILEKGIDIAKTFDDEVSKRYAAKLYFLKARGFLSDNEENILVNDQLNINEIYSGIPQAFINAYQAKNLDSFAAFNYHLLAKIQHLKTIKFHYDKQNKIRTGYYFRRDLIKNITDSIKYYENKAIKLAPNWSYPYQYLANQILDFTKNYQSENVISILREGLSKDLKNYGILLSLVKYYYPTNNNMISNVDSFFYFAFLAKTNAGNSSIRIDKVNDFLIAYYLRNEKIDSAIKLFTDIKSDDLLDETLSAIQYFYQKQKNEEFIYNFAAIMRKNNLYNTVMNISFNISLLNKHNIPFAKKILRLNLDSKNKTKLLRTYSLLAEFNWDMKEFDSCIYYYKKSLEIEKNNETYYNISCCYSLLKNKKEALYYLEQALANGYKDFAHIKEDKDLDFIRNTTDFAALLKKYNKKV